MRYYNDESVWNDFMSTCDCLPLCAIINDKIFAVHAGISPSLHHIDEINSLNRFQEIPLISFLLSLFVTTLIPQEGLFCDLLWSDPSAQKGWNPSSRGISQTYGQDVSEQFLLDNQLKCIVRGHELVMEVELMASMNRRALNSFTKTRWWRSFPLRTIAIMWGTKAPMQRRTSWDIFLCILCIEWLSCSYQFDCAPTQ